MRTYARIDAGAVAELLSTDQDITRLFHPSLHWVEVTGRMVEPGWVMQPSGFIPPPAAPIPPPLPPTLAQLHAQLTELAARVAALAPKA
jgi:hypothetical protein